VLTFKKYLLEHGIDNAASLCSIKDVLNYIKEEQGNRNLLIWPILIDEFYLAALDLGKNGQLMIKGELYQFGDYAVYQQLNQHKLLPIIVLASTCSIDGL